MMDGPYGLDVAFATWLAVGLWILLVVVCVVEAGLRRVRRRWWLALVLVLVSPGCDSPVGPPPAVEELVGTWEGRYSPDGLVRLSVDADLRAEVLDTCVDASGRLCAQVRGRYVGTLSPVAGGGVFLRTVAGDLRGHLRAGRLEVLWLDHSLTLNRR